MNRKPTAQTPLDFGHLTADDITAAILGYVAAHGFTAWAQPNRGEYNPTTQRWQPHPNARRGIPDILGFRRSDGRFLAIEVKAGRDQLRPEQIEFLNELKAAGGLAFVAFSYAGFVQSFERRGLHTPQPLPRHESLPPPPPRYLPPA